MKRSTPAAQSNIHVAEDIVPLNEFKATLSERLRELKTRQRPFIVTQNGRAAAVVLSPDEFDRLAYEHRFLSAVEEGLADGEAGRVITNDELTRDLNARFGSGSKRR
ncbi:MAG: type II toxin-antitoxin system Phd/YefM family antitoxin [Archangium sp.]